MLEKLFKLKEGMFFMAFAANKQFSMALGMGLNFLTRTVKCPR